jgi:hypothetical protein
MQLKEKKAFENLILAESGGNKTSWYIRKKGSEAFSILGLSLHPEFWNEDFESRFPKEVMELNHEEFDFIFFGAGCFRENSKNIFKSKIENLQFKSILIKGDIEAAAYAVLGNSPGWFMILGSGSVVCFYNGSEIEIIIGGNGEIDDFGSGRRFGRLISMAMSKENNVFKNKYLKILETVHEIEYSKIIDQNDAAIFHQNNLLQLIDKLIIPNIEAGSVLHVIGGYGAFLQKEFSSLLEENKYKMGKCIAQPMDELIKLY